MALSKEDLADVRALVLGTLMECAAKPHTLIGGSALALLAEGGKGCVSARKLLEAVDAVQLGIPGGDIDEVRRRREVVTRRREGLLKILQNPAPMKRKED